MTNVNEFKMEKQYKEYYAAYNSGLRKHDEARPTTYAKRVTWDEPGDTKSTKLQLVHR